MNIQNQKTIFITGSSSGLGRATAKLFASKGWKVIATMRNPEKETELDKLPGVVLPPLDITDPQQIKDAVEKAVTMGGVDVVFNNAGYGLAGPLEGLTDEQIIRMVNTNMMGAIRTTKAFIPCFREKRGRAVYQYNLYRRIDRGSLQLHISCHEMGAGRLERKHGF